MKYTTLSGAVYISNGDGSCRRISNMGRERKLISHLYVAKEKAGEIMKKYSQIPNADRGDLVDLLEEYESEKINKSGGNIISLTEDSFMGYKLVRSNEVVKVES